MNNCDKCGRRFDHYKSFYTDICVTCTEKEEGKNLSALEKEDGRHDDYEIKKGIGE